MKRYITRHIFTAGLAALALCALCFLKTPVRAQGMTGYTVIFPSVGLAPGQILRLTLSNPNDTPVRVQAWGHHSGGVNVALGDGSVRFVRAGVSYSFDLKRSDIPMPGEEGTGRIQLYGSVKITFSETIKPVVVSMETISISDGTSNASFFARLIPSQTSSGSGGNDTFIWYPGTLTDVYTGIAPGQKLRATLFNPPSFAPQAGLDAQPAPVGGHVKVFDGSDNLIAQSPEMVIPPGEFLSFDFDYYALPLIGEPGANRKQARIKPFFNFQSERLSPILASVEIVDNTTGKTTVLISEKPKEIVVVGSKL